MDPVRQSQLTVHRAAADIAFKIECFGDELARRQNYQKHTGMNAVHFYLVQTHHWTPAQVRSLNIEDLEFLLAEVMAGYRCAELGEA